MWYEQVKLNKQYHHAEVDIYHIYSVQENYNDKVSAMPDNHLVGWPTSPTLIIRLTHFFLSESKWMKVHYKEERVVLVLTLSPHAWYHR